MLYDVIVLEPSIMFCIIITCDYVMWPVTNVWHFVIVIYNIILTLILSSKNKINGKENRNKKEKWK